MGCVFSGFLSKKVYSSEEGKLGSKHAVKFSKRTWHQTKIGKEVVHREQSSKNVNLMSVVLARQNSGKDHMRRPCTKKDAPAE